MNALYSSDRLHRTNRFCLCTFRLILTQSFFPGICQLYLSSSLNLWTRSRVSCRSVLPFFGTGFARIPPTFFNSRAVRIKYSLTSNCFDAYFRDHLLGISESSQDTKQFSISPSQHHAAVLTLLLSTVHHFPQKQSQVSSTSLLTSYASVMVLLYMSTTLSNFCLALVVQLCYGTPCRLTGDTPTISKLVLRRFLGVSYTSYVASSKASS